jgi:translation initiation factor 3 subunit A
VACDLELWAEAFRSVEDIQALIALAKKQPKQQMMATYYAKLTQIFAMSGHHMYHAYAWLKLFSFSKSYNKNLTSGGGWPPLAQQRARSRPGAAAAPLQAASAPTSADIATRSHGDAVRPGQRTTATGTRVQQGAARLIPPPPPPPFPPARRPADDGRLHAAGHPVRPAL